MRRGSEADIQRLLASEFERRGWEYDLTVGRVIAGGMREAGGSASPAALGRLVSKGFLARAGATRADVVDAIARSIGDFELNADPSEDLGLVRAMNVLFVAAGPADESRLRLAAEHRDIADRIRSSTTRDQVVLDTVPAARPTDLIDAMNRHRPTILHLSGHGGQSGIALEDDSGLAADVTTEQLTRLVALAGPALRLVVLNTCESASQARPMTAHVDAAIGMTRSIGDEAARTFSAQLYASLAEGVALDRAFEQAKLQVSLSGSDEDEIPLLFLRAGVDPATEVFTTYC